MSIKKLSVTRRADPFLDREIEKYKQPLPSREYIALVMEEQGRPLGFSELIDLLTIKKAETEYFERRLQAMIRDGELMRNRKGAFILPDKVNLIAGHVEGHSDGYGFFIPDDGSEDIYVAPKQMRRVLHKDRVLVRRTASGAVIVEVLEQRNREIVGRVFEEHGIRFVSAENKRINQDILIPPETGGKKKRLRVRPGQIVVVEIIEQPTRYTQPIGRIKEIIGDHTDPGMEIEIALRKFDLPFEFDKATLDEAEKIPMEVQPAECKKRIDLRELPLVTIDGETAKDFDDAVYAEKNGRNWRLVVAIADVSHYVKPKTVLDEAALARGNSVYFPRRVIPMLPENISNGICSLNPDVDRLALVCDATISASGLVTDYRFYPAVFRSNARLTYDEVWAWLNGDEKPAGKTESALLPHLKNLYALFKVLHKQREKRGAIDFETTETMMIFNDNSKIDRIVPVTRNDAHRLIEECMLTANTCAADFLLKARQPALFRIHEGPTVERLAALREFLGEFGLQLTGGDDPKTKDYAQLLKQVKDRPDAGLLQTAMLKSLKQAMYSPDNVGHFGLAFEHYAHFTSPIRRYPDLLVHRAIKAVLDGKKYLPHDYGMAAEAMATARINNRRKGKDVAEKTGSFSHHEQWEGIGMHCSMTERRADEATRDVENWLKCYYMSDRIGERFSGRISATTSFGIFVILDDVYVEGLVHVSDLGADYFVYDAIKHWLIGERSGKRYRLGDSIDVRLVRADLETSRIDFALDVPAQATQTAPVEKKGRTARRRIAEAAPPPTPEPAREKTRVSGEKSKSTRAPRSDQGKKTDRSASATRKKNDRSASATTRKKTRS